MHVKIYGHMAFSLVRVDHHDHIIFLQAATIRALLSSISVVWILSSLPSYMSQSQRVSMLPVIAHRLLNRKALRASLRKTDLHVIMSPTIHYAASSSFIYA
jgi:hypothetical protein